MRKLIFILLCLLTLKFSLGNNPPNNANISTKNNQENITSFQNSKRNLILDVINQKNNEIILQKIKYNKLIRNLGIITGTFALMIGFIIFRLYWQLRYWSKLINKQKSILEIKNNDIIDSIKYAKRIQTAILPTQNIINQYLKNSFILYVPKDIVSGDFYWVEKINNCTYIAVADCTGHGVPAALMSVICSNALSKSLLEENITETGKILDNTNALIIKQFEKSEEVVQDGMDISICKIEDNIVQWSGANNPIWIIKSNSLEVLEIKADKQPIGKTENTKLFTTHKLELNKGDAIYMFTDGYRDQFGGEKNKKFTSKRLKELLLKSSGLSMNEQKEILEKNYAEWLGSGEQIDDITFVGIKI